MTVVDLGRVRRALGALDAVVRARPDLVDGRRAGALAECLEGMKEGEDMAEGHEGREAWALGEAAAMLGLNPATLRRAIHKGELAAFTLGKGYRVSRAELAAWWRSKGGGELFAEPAPGPHVNREGMTFAEWTAAAGPQVNVHKARVAWLAGEDPTDYRAEG